MYINSTLCDYTNSLKRAIPKIQDFTSNVFILFAENFIQFEVAKRMSTWSSIAFFLAIAVNLIVAMFYPYMNGQFNAIGGWGQLSR